MCDVALAPWQHTQAIPSRAEFWHAYAFKERLGAGQFGEVWRCVERSTGRNFACKEMEAKSEARWGKVRKEVDSMRALMGHRGVVQLHEVHREGDSVYVVMELCNSGDLYEAISRTQEGLSEEVSREIFGQLAAGLAHCHAQGFLHRDIKPENVLLHREGSDCTGALSVRLADFGLAECIGEGTTRGRCGSAQYAAPEVRSGGEYSYPADVWSLGVVLYAMLQADWPELDKTGAVIISENWRNLSFEAQDLLARMLMLEPCTRPSMQQVLQHSWVTCSQ